MTGVVRTPLLWRVLLQPRIVFEQLAEADPSPSRVFFTIALWLGIVPPVLFYFGSSTFGWRLGAVDPIVLPEPILLQMSVAYFLALLFGFGSAAVVSRWMAITYGARQSLGVHCALMTIVGAPLAVGSVIHLYPNVFINVLALVPVLIWSMYLLYRGLPIVLHTTPERGMLMASSLIGYLLVAAVSLLGITVVLWGYGVGPTIGI